MGGDMEVIRFCLKTLCRQDVQLVEHPETARTDIGPFLPSILAYPLRNAGQFRYDPQKPAKNGIMKIEKKQKPVAQTSLVVDDGSDDDSSVDEEIDATPSRVPPWILKKLNPVQPRGIVGADSVSVLVGGETLRFPFGGKHDTVQKLKLLISVKTGTPINQLSLELGSHWIKDEQTLTAANIRPRSTIEAHILHPSFVPNPIGVSIVFDPRFDRDYTTEKPNGMNNRRGDVSYDRPYGWKRYGLDVIRNYNVLDWFGECGPRIDSTPKEWPVGYTMMSISSLDNVMRIGYSLGVMGEYCEEQILTMPSLHTAETFSDEIEFRGKAYKVLLQTRVNPMGVNKKTLDGKEVWLSPSAGDVRPYGILIRDLSVPRYTFLCIL